MRWPLLLAILCSSCRNTEQHEAEARPVFEVSADRAQLGYDAPFSIAVRFPATTRGPTDVQWKQLEGLPLRDVAIGEGGRRFAARTARLTDCRQGAVPWGVVPISPRTRGEVVLEATWRGAHDEGRRERLVVAAAARSRGLPNVPVDQRLYLGGSGWRVDDGPPDGRAKVEERDGIATFRAETRGIWQLIDGEGRSLRIQAGRYGDTPLDCGRASCHRAIARAVQSSPMTWALSRRLQDRAHRGDAAPNGAPTADDVACAAACHTTGEPWTHDGGFFDVTADFGLSPSLEGVSELRQLPREARRLGSVGCLACHGPSALPEAEARWSILRNDVCAHCHDAPPRYAHVAALQSTSMAHADRDEQARSDGACTPCHTTWGFLGDAATTDRKPPSGVGHVGITCPACHAVHDVSVTETRRSLLRTPPLAAMFDAVPEEARVRSGACLPCHAPRDTSRLPEASASAMWAGRGGVDPETGATLASASPHLSIAGGCVGCHREGPDGIERGKSHGFRADRKLCASCHTDTALSAQWADDGARVEKDARALWDGLRTLGAFDLARRTDAHARPEPRSVPPHASTVSAKNADPAVARAAHDLALILEDRGFLSHNLPYARLLLERARPTIERAVRAAPHRAGREPTR